MADINTCIFSGRVGSDCQMKVTQAGDHICQLSLAVERQKKQGEDHGEVDWLDFVAFGGSADFCEKYLKKGRKVVIECYARVRRWEDREGHARRSTEFVVRNVTFADQKRTDGSSAAAGGESVPDVKAGAEDSSVSSDLPF